MKESEETPAYEAREHSKSFLKRALSDKKGGTMKKHEDGKHHDGKKEHKGKHHHKGMKK